MAEARNMLEKHEKTAVDPVRHVRIAIVGSGFAGLGMAMRLKKDGVEDFVLFERADGLGGVWRDNSYPNCACDVESHLYSFSFEQNPNWSRAFSPQGEILAYLQKCARDYGLEPHLRFRHDVQEARWDGDARRWHIRTAGGNYTADIFIAAAGALSDPKMPRFAGLESFEGTSFHSARWNHDCKLQGKNVAVIGTGASAVQFIPALQKQAARLSVFQRTAPWVMPRHDRAFSAIERTAFRSFGLVQQMKRGGIYAFRELLATSFLYPKLSGVMQGMAERFLKREVKDPVLRKKLTPNYSIGCKRILLSDEYLNTLTQSNVDVVTENIREISAKGIVTADGKEHAADVIIFGTGFQVQELPMLALIYGKRGRSLRETWQHTMTAHLGTTVVDFPNFFILQGPNTGLGHTSVITMIESQFTYVLDALHHMRDRELAVFEPRQEAQDAFVAEVDAKMKKTVWTNGGCESWYFDRSGRISTLWPGFTFTFRKRLERFRPEEYRLSAGGAR